MKKVAVLCGLAFVVAAFLGDGERAEARPTYLKGFATKYPDLAEKAKEAKCGVCHPEKDKKVRNEYGMALGKLTGKNQKDADKIAEALGKAEEAKAKSGKTFGEIIKSGELPN